MYRTFTYINFALLVLLGGTCAFQWKQERAYGRRVSELQKQSNHQQDRLLVQAEDLHRTREDLDGFKDTVARLTTQAEEQAASIRERKAELFVLEAEKEKLTRQLAVWESALAEHKAALANRDDAIQTLLGQRDQILAAQADAAGKANEAVAAYNELAAKYEDVVGRYNTLAALYQSDNETAAAR